MDKTKLDGAQEPAENPRLLSDVIGLIVTSQIANKAVTADKLADGVAEGEDMFWMQVSP